MNEMQLIEFTPERIVYLYTPSGVGDPGEIEYIFSKKEARVSRHAGNDSPSFAHHAILAVEKRVEENNLPIKFTNAWY